MNYEKHYGMLIDRARCREVSEYTESHHILPRCMGGSDDPDNLVILTAREHFIAHLLLYKIHPNQYGLIKAINMMCAHHTIGRINNRMYSWLRKKLSEEMSRSQTGEGNSQYGKKWIYNLILKESKSVKSEEVPIWIERGWNIGRIINFNNMKECVVCKNLTFNKHCCSLVCVNRLNAINKQLKTQNSNKVEKEIKHKQSYNNGEINSQFGSKYMHNATLHLEKRVNLKFIDDYILDGWSLGQLPMFCEYCNGKISKNTLSRHKCLVSSK